MTYRWKSSMLLVVTLFLMAGAAPGLVAQSTITWTRASGLDGARVSQLAICPDGTVIAGDRLSVDGGATWSEIVVEDPDPAVRWVAVSSVECLADGVLLAGTTNWAESGEMLGGSLFKSDDRGATWTYVEGFRSSIDKMVGGPADEITVLAGKELFVSTGGGQMFHRRLFLLDFCCLSAAAVNEAGDLVAGMENGRVTQSKDGGVNWENIGELLDGPITALALSENGDVFAGVGTHRTGGLFLNPGGLFRFSEEAQAWAAVDLGQCFLFFPGTCSVDVYSLTVTAEGHLVVGTSYRLFRSEDGGQSWTWDGPDAPFFEVRALAVGADQSVLAGTGQGLYRASANGQAWSRLALPHDWEGLNVSSIVSTGAGDLFAATSQDGAGGIYRSQDGGLNWHPVNTGLINPDVAALTTDPSGRLYAGFVNFEEDYFCFFFSPCFVRKKRAGVQRSDDGGRTWVPAGLEGYTIRSLAYAPGEVLLAATYVTEDSTASRQPLFRSMDHGETWTETDVDGLRRLWASPDGMVYGRADQGLLRSADSGETWTDVGLSEYWIESMHFNAQGHLYAFTYVEHGLFISRNQGATWAPVEAGVAAYGTCYSFALGAATDLYAACSNVGSNPFSVVIRSEDDGASWRILNDGPGGLDFPTLYFHQESGHLFAFSARDGLLRTSMPVATANEEADVPSRFVLEQNYPNPFNPSTRIAFELPHAARVRVTVVDLLGREVAVLVEGRLGAGRHEARWSGVGQASGVYLYRLEADGVVQNRKMLLLK